MHETHNTLPLQTRERVVAILQERLADAIDLRLTVKQAHWTVKGPDFIQLHELFDSFVAPMDEQVDEMAERIAQLGGTPDGTARTVAGNSSLPPYDTGTVNGMDHVGKLVEAFAGHGKKLRTDIDRTAELGDADTSDLLTAASRAVDKALWFLEAHLQAKS